MSALTDDIPANGNIHPVLSSANFINPKVVTAAMSHERDDAEYLKRGRQRAAVAQTLKKPMTGTEICSAARALNPHIQLRDIWHLLHEMEQHELVFCLTPRLVTGRLYWLTAKGRMAVQDAFRISVNDPPSNIDWRRYSWVVRAKIRRLTLIGLGHLEEKGGEPQTATTVRKRLISEHGVGLNPVIRALKDLLRLGLVRHAGLTKKHCCTLYSLTPAGKRILEQLQC
jgi:DNA-binding PadR family transcriptional regulator